MTYTEHSCARPSLMQELKAAKYSTRENAVMLCSEAYYEILRLQADNDALMRALGLALGSTARRGAPGTGGEGRVLAS